MDSTRPGLAPNAVPAWLFRGHRLELGRARIMGILNVTPDSFSDGGLFLDPAAASRHAERLVKEGADILDVGGESTRPGSSPVTAEEEIRRVVPVIREVARLGVPVSVDTAKASVAAAALQAGASIVNDVTALSDPGMSAAVAGAGAGLVLMHMQGTPRTMQEAPRYGDVVTEVAAFLASRRDAAVEAGIDRESIVLDPGIGFGKLLDHNLALLDRLGEIVALGCPVLVGVSRKSFLDRLTGVSEPEARLGGSLAAALAARSRGAALFRVHDVSATRHALDVMEAIRAASGGIR